MTEPRIALLTGGDDKSYVLGLTGALTGQGLELDVIGSDRLDTPELRASPGVRFLNLRGDQREDARAPQKVRRILIYYWRLVRYAITADTAVFHILWNNKFEHVDRTLLMWLYRACGRKVVLTAHNVNAARRDGRDSWLNRMTLRIQYSLCDQVFVHSEQMKRELMDEFRVAGGRVSVIPFGLNATTPDTALTPTDARRKLDLPEGDRIALCFGQIAPYKGVEYLLSALEHLARDRHPVRVLIAGKVKRGHEDYWRKIEQQAASPAIQHLISTHIGFVPDSEVELFFKAADVVVLPYVSIFQSGVPFLAYAYGVPVIATDVGALRDDIDEGVTGYLCAARDPEALAGALRRFYSGHLYTEREEGRAGIRQRAAEQHSWARVGAITRTSYRDVMGRDRQPGSAPAR